MQPRLASGGTGNGSRTGTVMSSYREKEKEMKAPLIAHVIFRLDVGGLENGLVNLINEMPPGAYRHAIICVTHTLRRSGIE